MPNATPSEFVSKICKEAALFDSKDRLLNFSTKGEFQTPLMLEAGDLFYEKWKQSGSELPLDKFLPVSNTFTTQQKEKNERNILTVLRGKEEDFGNTDLYLILGFLKWDGNALVPTLFIPLDADLEKRTLKLANRTPIENVILRERFKDTISLPKVEEATINGQFSILMYFSLFEKSIVHEKNWKFTRHGVCLAFLNTARLRMKKALEQEFSERQINNTPFLQSLFSDDGFQVHESIFESGEFDQIYNPADHHFLYTTDSHTTKAAIDALDNDEFAFAVQTLPGTYKTKIAANIAAETVAQGKRTLVISRRAVSKRDFMQAWQPPFRSFDGPNRDLAEKNLRTMRSSIFSYYNIANKHLMPANVGLSDLLSEFVNSPATKTKFPESIFQNTTNLDYKSYLSIKADVEEVVKLYFENDGLNTRKAFLRIKVPSLTEEQKQNLTSDLNAAAEKAKSLEPLVSLMQKIGLFPTGIYLSGLADILELIQKNFNKNTPVFEDWELRSSNWIAYQDSLKALPEAGDKWIRYRRQTSEIYTDNAVDANILSAREDFASSLKATLKGFSDHYRTSKKILLKVLRNPKSVSSDEQLLDLIDTLIELQENKRAYKDTSVLGNHLLGKDWLYEKSNWVELHDKIEFLYRFREKHKNDPQLDLLLLILEQWHNLNELFPQFKQFAKSIQELLTSIRRITKDLNLETPLESLCIDKWMDEIQNWNNHWNNLDVHLQLMSQFNKIESAGLFNLSKYLQNTDKIHKDIASAFAHYWAGSQVQHVSKLCPDMFNLSPKDRSQQSKAYRTILDQFSNANFREIKDILAKTPDLFKFVMLDEAFELSRDSTYDVAIFLDADCISVVESLPVIVNSKKIILVGDPHMPALEPQPLDAHANVLPRHTAFFQENIMAAALRRGIPSRELRFATSYSDVSLLDFANEKIYNHGIMQFPNPNRENAHNTGVKIVQDKVAALVKAAIQHAEKHPGQTLGIIAFNQARCLEIEQGIQAALTKGSPAERFFRQTDFSIRYYIKTPERAADRYRDVILICLDVEGSDRPSTEHKLATCTTLAKQEMQAFISETDMQKKPPRSTLFWDWIEFLQNRLKMSIVETKQPESVLLPHVTKELKAAGIIVEPSFSRGGIPVGPVIVDANNNRRFLSVIEDDCTSGRFRESIEDREYIRPTMLRIQGWKVMNLWTPFWFMAHADELSHLVTTIAIEQSVAPPPPEATGANEAESSEDNLPDYTIEAYVVTHPKIEGTNHDRPIAELPAPALVTQLKFYVDHEAPIHEELLMHRLLELHKVDRAGPKILQALTDAIKQGIQTQRFIKTGKFFYSIKNPPIVLRDRGLRPDNERKLAYVSPEERALFPASMDEHAIKQALSLLE